MSWTKTCFSLVAAMLVVQASVAHAGFTSFVIREGGGGPPAINPNTPVAGQTEFVISAGGQKAGLGSNDINGATIGQISNLTITRHDDTTRFAAGSGPAVAPYLNFWVTDGLGNFAVLANEPSNPAFQPLFVDNGNGTKSYNLSFADLADKVVKVYETLGAGTNTSWVHTMFGAGPLTFADVATLQILAPSAAYILDGANAVTGGAPRELGTNVAYGMNWVFGDTLTNYVSGDDGYIVSDARVSAASAVPEPASIAVFSLLIGVGLVRLRKNRG